MLAMEAGTMDGRRARTGLMCSAGCGGPADPTGRSSMQIGPVVLPLCERCAAAGVQAMRVVQAAMARLRAWTAAIAPPARPRPMLMPPPMTDPPISVRPAKEGC